jgi:hypothetical protein
VDNKGGGASKEEAEVQCGVEAATQCEDKRGAVSRRCDKRRRRQRTGGGGVTRGGATIDNQPEKERGATRDSGTTRGSGGGREGRGGGAT